MCVCVCVCYTHVCVCVVVDLISIRAIYIGNIKACTLASLKENSREKLDRKADKGSQQKQIGTKFSTYKYIYY